MYNYRAVASCMIFMYMFIKQTLLCNLIRGNLVYLGDLKKSVFQAVKGSNSPDARNYCLHCSSNLLLVASVLEYLLFPFLEQLFGA